MPPAISHSKEWDFLLTEVLIPQGDKCPLPPANKFPRKRVFCLTEVLIPKEEVMFFASVTAVWDCKGGLESNRMILAMNTLQKMARIFLSMYLLKITLIAERD